MSTRTRRSPSLSTIKALGLSALGLALPLGPSFEAKACGGTFCDAGPQSMPVDQSGETLLFVKQGEQVEAHIQIIYEGDPEKFAWIVPVPAVPEVEAGSQLAFDALLSATQPSLFQSTTFDPCEDGSVGCAATEASRADVQAGGFGLEEDGGGGQGGDENGGPQIIDRGSAGSFDYVTLTGGTAQEVVDWLDMAGYAQDEDAPPILQEYLDEGFVFVAFRLQSGADLDAIHPVVLRYEGMEPCIPLRLTSIAATPDMGIRAFFLDDHRWVPHNYDHVVLNELALSRVSPIGDNYTEVLSLAVDEAGGQAFVTEYVGPSSIVDRNGVWSDEWDAARFSAIEPTGVVVELENQGLAQCGEESCGWNHPLIASLLDEFLPVPAGVDQDAFYSCLSCYEDQIDPLAWNAMAFSTAFADRIEDPGLHAFEVLAIPTLTRIATTIDAHEMTLDPIFTANPDLPVDGEDYAPLLTRQSSYHFGCDGPDYIELDDERRIALPQGAQSDWSILFEASGEMPAAARIERFGAAGPAMVVEDKSEEIEAILSDHNEQLIDGPEGCQLQMQGSRRIGLAVLPLWLLLGLRRRRSS